MTEAVEESCKLESRAERAKNVVLSKGGAGPIQYVDTMAMASNQLLGVAWLDGFGNAVLEILVFDSGVTREQSVIGSRKALVLILDVLSAKDGQYECKDCQRKWY